MARTKSLMNVKLKKLKEMQKQGFISIEQEEKDVIILGLQLKNEQKNKEIDQIKI